MPLSLPRWWPFRDRAAASPPPGAAPRPRARRPAAPDAAPPDAHLARLRTRQRLVGAAVLLALGVAVFGLLFETEPRPGDGPDAPQARRDIGQVQPARPEASEATPPADLPEPQAPVDAAASEAAGPASTPADPPVAALSAPPPPASLPAASPAPPVVPEPASPPPPTRPAASPPAQVASPTAPAAPTAPAPDSGERARALLEGRPAPTPAAGTAASGSAPAARVAPSPGVTGRYAVQVGAFSDPAALREARLRVERLKFRTYTQVIQTPQGERTRLRVGPFATRAEAEAAAERLKAARFPAILIPL